MSSIKGKILKVKEKLKRISLGLKLELVSLIMLLIIMPLIIVSIISYNVYKKSLLIESSDYSYKIVCQTCANLDMYIEDMINLSLMPLYDKEIIDLLENDENLYFIDKQYAEMYRFDKLKNFMFMMNNLRTEIDGVFIYGTDERVYHNIHGKGAIGTYNYNSKYNYKESDWYQRAKEAGGKSLIIGTHTQEQVLPGDKEVFSLAKIIKNSGREIGAILIDVNLNKIEQICNEVIYSPNEGIIVYDEKDGVIFCDFNDIPIEIDSSFYKSISNEYSGNFQVKLGRSSYLVTYKKLNYTEWKVIRLVAISSLLNATKLIKQLTILTLIFCIGFSIVLVLILSTRITRPIYTLIKEMKRVENGDLNVHVNICGNNEIGKLSDSFNKMVDKLNNMIYRVYTAELQQREAQLAALQSQINPHFLYNTLDSIHMMAEINLDFAVSKMVTSLAEILRYSIDGSTKMVCIGDELCHVRNYIDVQQTRYGDALKFFVDVPEKVKATVIPKLTMQPIIENCIYHGMDSEKDRNFIMLKAQKINDMIKMEIIDNGKGMTEEQLQNVRNAINENVIKTNSGSIGLSNVNQRLKAYFGDDFGIKVNSTIRKGTVVSIIIPFKMLNEAGDMQDV